ncbi:ATP-binding protein [Chitinophaga silvatica]|uniref:ATP-binding protein n=1 Tax=Chitinophaga silvatica TaxID=2282649 RepID=A0A3E1Y7G7_9BACT|nr:ATP-binding protein [Chitinophaga silvatica]RFS21041.1 ATP-binding protein [Chitinophaga silvatica]
MEKLIGRELEKKILREALSSKEAELIAVYGRRRVGKTFLIRQVYQDQVLYEFSGVHNAPVKQQLENFRNTIALTLNSPILPAIPQNWNEAFLWLIQLITPQLQKQKVVVFFDEFPWLSSKKSGFLPAFEYFWNSWGTKQSNLIIAICGSAASWMIQRVVNNKGGLHNRITRKIRLLPFTLHETATYLKSRSINLDHYQILQIYMAMGGIPQYLKEVRKGESATQVIDRLCFTKDGLLLGEFNNLYNSLFETADRHILVVKAIANKPSGLTRNEIIEETGLQTGGTTTKLLEELVQSGFVNTYLPFGKNTKDLNYKLADEYSLFYLKFIENSRATGNGTWIKKSTSQSWKSWSGMAFENICMKHSHQIKLAMGISGIYSEESTWRSKSAQINLLIDRQDNCINICEMKFSNSEFIIDKSYAAELQRKLTSFQNSTATTKTLFLTMITTFGVKDNQYKSTLVHQEVTLEDLYKS